MDLFRSAIVEDKHILEEGNGQVLLMTVFSFLWASLGEAGKVSCGGTA